MINEYLLDYIGKTGTKNNLNDAIKSVLENKKKVCGFQARPSCINLTHVEQEKEILSLGASVPDDIFTDNMLSLLSGICRARIALLGMVNIQLTNEIDVTEGYAIVWGQPDSGTTNTYSGMTNQIGGALNCGIQLGQGNAIPTRQDFKIENPFNNGGDEDNRQIISTPAYDEVNFRNNFVINFIATGAGDISEAVLMNKYLRTSPRNPQFILISRDLVFPAVSFTTGNSIFSEYVVQY